MINADGVSKIEQELEKLRKKWQEYPERRSTIELQAKILKLGLKKFEKVDQIDTAKKEFGI